MYEGDDSYVCPRSAVTEDARRWLDLYPHYEKGHLLRRGALEDQPALYIEAMRIIAHAAEQARSETRGA